MIETGSLRTLLIIAVLAYAAVVAFLMLSAISLDNHECLVSVTAREMLANNNWIVPTFNGEVRLQKTPLNYWLVCFASKITGSVDEFTTRLPSAIFGVLSAAAILFFTSQWLGLPIAAMSTAIWVSTLAFSRYSHNGRPEMTLCASVAVAMMSFYSAMESKTRRQQIIYMLVFWFSFAIGMLAKGPTPLVLVLPPIFCYFLIFKKWNKIKLTLPIIGAILFLVIVVPWPAAVLIKITHSGAFWKREFIDRFMGEYASGHKPFWYYLGIMFVFTAPFSAFVPYIIAAPFYPVWEKKRPVMWYLWLWFVVQVVVMSICGGKRQHYILSVFPAFSILAGICLSDMIFEQKVFKLKQVKVFFACHIIVLAALAAGLLYWTFTRAEAFIGPSICISLMFAIIVAAVVILFVRKHNIVATVLLFAGYYAVLAAIFIYFLIPLSPDIPLKNFSLKIGRIVPAGEKLIAYHYVAARTINYVGRTIPKISDLEEVYKRYEQGEWVIASDDDYEKLVKDGRFNMVYYCPMIERHGPKDVPAALFHKSN